MDWDWIIGLGLPQWLYWLVAVEALVLAALVWEFSEAEDDNEGKN